MIIAGIDEAGYGPVLGPLVVGCCAVATPDGEDLPCLWKRLSRMVSRTRCRQGKRLHVNDSKQVYSPSQGLKELERSVLSLIEQLHGPAGSLSDIFGRIDGQLRVALDAYPWYADALDADFPLSIDSPAMRISANALKIESERAQTHVRHYAAHVLLERQFNEMVEKTRNKASASFSLVARHIDALLRQFSDQNLTIVCDRQGGREHYGHVLRVMFEDWSLAILSESGNRAEYRLSQGSRSARIIFCENAETVALPVAAASMLAKYTREALMHRFNRYWQQHQPSLHPTAGYYTDGWRFLNEIQELRTRLGVPDWNLIRQR